MFIEKDRLINRCQRMSMYSSLKSLQILEALSCVTEYVSITDLCEVTGLSASTTHRILQELADSGYVSKNEERKYHLGFEAMNLGMRVQMSDYLLEAAKDEMRRLNDLSLETVHLIALNQYQGVYIGKLDAKNQIGLRSRVGWNLPLHCTGGGKAMLAYQTDEWFQAYLKNTERVKFTEKTHTEEDDLRRELETIRCQGYALDDREHHTDVTCVSAPVFGVGGKVVCAISISAPDYRFPLDRAIELAEEVKASAEAVSRRLQQI